MAFVWYCKILLTCSKAEVDWYSKFKFCRITLMHDKLLGEGFRNHQSQSGLHMDHMVIV